MSSTGDKDKANRRKLIRPNLEAIDKRHVTDTAKVTVMLSRAERASIFERVLRKRITTPEAEAKNHGVPRPLIMHALAMETQEYGQRERVQGYVAGKREALTMPTPPRTPAPAQTKRAA
jgi:hypothetical protein